MSDKSKIDNCPNGKLSQKYFEQLHSFREIFICICLELIISGKLANIFNHHTFQNILNTFCCCCWQCLTVFDNFGQFYKFWQLWPFLLLCQLYYIPGGATCKCIAIYPGIFLLAYIAIYIAIYISWDFPIGTIIYYWVGIFINQSHIS